jgi:4-hydroxybenzoate polyprenyltransferase
MNKLFTKNDALFLLFFGVFLIINQFKNIYLSYIYIAVLFVFGFLKLIKLYRQDKENNTKTAKNHIITLAILIVIAVIYRLAIKYFFYSEPL